MIFLFFFFNDTATTEIYTLSLHDALPICFPRTVAQAEAFDDMLARHGLKLDGVIEFQVDEGALVKRIETRAAEAQARGEPVRKDDNPEVFKTRLEAYRAQTAPLSAYYREKGALKSVAGMKPIDEVTREIFAKLDSKGA